MDKQRQTEKILSKIAEAKELLPSLNIGRIIDRAAKVRGQTTYFCSDEDLLSGLEEIFINLVTPQSESEITDERDYHSVA